MAVKQKLDRMLNQPYYFHRPRGVVRRIGDGIARPGPRWVEETLPWGHSIRINTGEGIGRSIYFRGVFDLVVTETAHRLLEGGEAALDVGANIGYMTSLMASRAGRDGSVTAFEPHPHVYQQLEANVRKWRAQPNTASIELRNEAASSESGEAVLRIPRDFQRNQGIASLEAVDDAAGEDEHFRVPTRRLDELFPDQSFGLCKVDVEGHELAVFEGASRLLEAHRIRDILFEDHDVFPTSRMTFLKERGYEVFRLGRTFWGPRLFPAEEQASTAPGESPNYLATTLPDRARSRLSGRGWQIFRSRS